MIIKYFGGLPEIESGFKVCDFKIWMIVFVFLLLIMRKNEWGHDKILEQSYALHFDDW